MAAGGGGFVCVPDFSSQEVARQAQEQRPMREKEAKAGRKGRMGMPGGGGGWRGMAGDGGGDWGWQEMGMADKIRRHGLESAATG